MPKLGEVSTNFLNSLVGKDVVIDPLSGSLIKGHLITFDEFTIIISKTSKSDALPSIRPSIKQRMMFKHAIESICEA